MPAGRCFRRCASFLVPASRQEAVFRGGLIMKAHRSGYRVVIPAVVLAVLFILAGLSQPQEPQPSKPARESASVRGETAGDATPAPERLTSKPCPSVVAPPSIKVGDAVETGPGQHRRVLLEGGVVLYVNQNTKLKYIQGNHVAVTAGEVAVDVPLRPLGDGGAAVFGIGTPHKDFAGNDGLWAARVDDKGTAISVARGAVKVQEDHKQVIVSEGQELRRNQDKPTPLPRASHVLDWMKELMAAAASPLVPASAHAGGALVARDPDGQEARISLRKFHVDVHIEDGFARTTIDQTYFNQESMQLEGTFYFPLPPDASLSGLAMYVDGNLMEGGMAERDHARQVYETIRYANRDPALLEWVDGSTFKMRVFPLEPRQEKRIILSYTQKLPNLYGQTTYRFPAGHSMQKVEAWSFFARVKNAAELAWNSPSHPNAIKPRKDGGDLLLQASAKNAPTDKDVTLSFTEKQADDAPRFYTSVHEGAQYLMLRYRPKLELPTPNPERGNRFWVFLFDASADRDPLLGRAQIEVIRNYLTHVEPSDQFLVATANTRVRFASAQPQEASASNVKAAVEFLDNAHLIGALDLANAFGEIRKALGDKRATYLIHVGTGSAAMGEQGTDTLLKALPEGTRYVGVGVGRRWNRAFMKAAAEKTGGHFTQINPDEPIAWRAFDLFATLNTPRLMNVQVAAANAPGLRFLTLAESIAQGEEICALTRVGPEIKLPKTVEGTGTIAGKPYKQELKPAMQSGDAGYLPRTWAKLEIDRLLAEDPLKHKKTIVDLSKAMYVMTPFTSLLVLENEDLYTQYKVDRGRKDHWAMYDLPAKIPVVFQPDPNAPDPKSGKLRAKQVAETVLARPRAGFFTPIDDGRPQRASFQSTIVKFDRLQRAHEDGAFVYSALARETPAELHMQLAESIAPMGFGATLKGNDNETVFLGALRADWGVEVALQSPASFQRAMSDPLAPEVASRLEVQLLRQSRAGELPRPNQLPDLADLDGSIRRAGPITVPMLGGTAAGITPAESFTPELKGLFRNIGVGVDKATGRDWDGNGLTQDEALKQLEPMMDSVIGDQRLFLKAGKQSGKGASIDDLLAGSRSRESLLYRRPAFNGDLAIFSDLVGYCPGLNTSAADVRAVLEAEAHEYVPPKKGDVGASARELLGRARDVNWQTWTRDAKDGKPAMIVTFDGAGRFVCERILSFG